MKIEYNEMGFPQEKSATVNVKELFKKNAPLFLGVMSLVAALSLLPIGFFVNISLDILGNVLAEDLTHYTVIFLTVSALIAILSVAFAILSILLFKKSEKSVQDALGVIFSVVAFCVCAVAITLIILGLLVW